MNSTICFIPVRKGSKGIPGKNLKELGGKPLICWVVDSILASGIADQIWVATDCDSMGALIQSRYNGKIKIYRRSEWSARDKSLTIDVVLEFLHALNLDNDDRFILLQATSPFTHPEELRALNNEMLRKEYDSFIACCRLKKFHWSEDGKPLDYSFESKPMRQAYKGLLIESGAFYASTVGGIKASGQLLSGSIKTMEIGQEGLIDIDEDKDWRQAENYLRFLTQEKDYYIEFYEKLDKRLEDFVCKQKKEREDRLLLAEYDMSAPLILDLFYKFTCERDYYNQYRSAGMEIDAAMKRIDNILLELSAGEWKSDEENVVIKDWNSHPWFDALKEYKGQVLIYIFNQRQLNYLSPFISKIGQPVVLLTEHDLPEDTDLPEYVTALTIGFPKQKAFGNAYMEKKFSFLFHYANSFCSLLNILTPKSIVCLEGCHVSEHILAVIAEKENIPTVCIQQGWPSMMRTGFRRIPFRFFFAWGEKFCDLWSKYNPVPKFLPMGYMYEVKSGEMKKEYVTFFLQGPYYLSSINYLNEMLELVTHAAKAFPQQKFMVREHPEYRMRKAVVEKWKLFPNIEIASDMELTEVYRRTQIVIAHFSSSVMEGLLYGAAPLIYDPTANSYYYPNIEQEKIGRIAKTVEEFDICLQDMLEVQQPVLVENTERMNKWFAEKGEATLQKMTDFFANTSKYGNE